MANVLSGLLDRTASSFIVALAAVIGIVGGPRTITVAPAMQAPGGGAAAQTAIILRAEHQASIVRFAAAATSAPTATRSVASSTDSSGPALMAMATATIVPGLLPTVILKKAGAVPASSLTAADSATSPASPPKNTPTKEPTPAPAPPSAAAPTIALPMTARAVLADTTTTLTTQIGGAYGLVFNLIPGGRTVLSWQYGNTTIGGTGGIPSFTAAYNCNPPPGPTPGSLSGTSFAVRTSYACTVSLTALSGNDLRTMSRTFLFNTGPGSLTASPPANMNTHLSNTENDGGFVFTNTDTKQVSILSETFNIDYTGLITAYGPLVLRLVDPADPTHYLDYHLEDLPLVSSSSYEHRVTGLTLSWPLKVPASDARILPIKVLGVHKLSIQGLNPTVTIVLTGVTTDRNDLNVLIGMPQIAWSCVVTTGFYDPNATSGPFATGEACQN